MAVNTFFCIQISLVYYNYLDFDNWPHKLEYAIETNFCFYPCICNNDITNDNKGGYIIYGNILMKIMIKILIMTRMMNMILVLLIMIILLMIKIPMIIKIMMSTVTITIFHRPICRMLQSVMSWSLYHFHHFSHLPFTSFLCKYWYNKRNLSLQPRSWHDRERDIFHTSTMATHPTIWLARSIEQLAAKIAYI